MTEIYALCDEDGSIRYIGKANNAKARLKGHMRDARRRNTPVYCWMRKRLAAGIVPTLRILATCSDEAWNVEERRAISEAKASGARLLNVAEGGDEPFCSKATRAANGRKNAAAIHADPERKRIWSLKRRIGAALKGGYVLEETKAKLREAARNAPHLFGAWANI